MQDSRVVRVFISSPGDVAAERSAAAGVVRRLDRGYRPFFRIEPYLWEQEPQLASGHFQDYLEPPSQFDVVLLILWSRLGTPLPERTRVREYCGADGRAPVTGTEWEYEEARVRAEATGAPALLVFRNEGEVPISATDLASQARQLDQLKALAEFWQRHFEDRGIFLTAHTFYRGLMDFETKLERQLRRVFEELARKEAAAPILWFECPFRGLEAYDFEHAQIFFGRDAAMQQARNQLAANAADGTAFLLILGASGSGKSSLVRAGLVPELYVPRSVPGVGAWRRVLFRPGQGADLFLGVARSLTQADPRDVGTGLPELLSEDFSVHDLGRHLRDSSHSPAAPFQLTLGSLARNLVQEKKLLEGERVRLVLLVDQLEELFTLSANSAEDRARFVALLAGLARSGGVWVIATMRSDFWHRVAEVPLLAELASGSGRLDLWPPSPAELLDIIRGPAAAAGLRFDRDENRVPLDARIADEAGSAPGILPLLSYALETLYRRDVTEGLGNTLRWRTYREFGGLQGAIASRADEMVAELTSCGVDDRVLARVLRRLVSLDETEGGRLVGRSATLAVFGPGTADRRLVDAFLRPDMRLLVAEGDTAEARVRLAHEALLTAWGRAQRLLAEDVVNLARRRRLEEAERRWREADPEDRPGLMLRPGLDLNEAEALFAAWSEEIDPALRDYVARSEDDERRRIEEREDAARQLAERLAEAQLNQSRFLTSFAEAELREGHIERALLIAREALPADMRKPDRPIWNGAFQPIAEARERDRTIAVAAGHQNTVRSAAFSPDGTRVVTASDDKTARLWDGKTGALLVTLQGHRGEVHSAAFSPDGVRMVTASRDKTARIWDCKTGALLVTLQGHQRGVFSAAFSSDGSRVVTVSFDRTARLWDGKIGAALAVLEWHEGTVQSAAFSPEGARIVTTFGDKTAQIWDGKTGALLATLEGHPHLYTVVCAAYSPDGTRIVTTSDDNTARLWDGETGALLATLEGHADTVWSAAFSPDGRRIVTTSDDKTARLWESETGALIATLEGHTDTVWRAAFSPDGRRIVTTSLGDDKAARVWDGKTGALLATLQGHQGRVWSAAFSPDGAHIVTASDDGTARLWDGKIRAALPVLDGHQAKVNSAAFSPEGARIVTASNDGTARLWDAKTGALLATLVKGHQHLIHTAAFSAEGARIVTASDDRTARLWDGKTGALLVTLPGHQGGVYSAAFSPDGSRIVTASNDGTARLWDGKTGALLATLPGHQGGVYSAAFSPDGSRVVTASSDNTARLWDGKTGSLLTTLKGHTHDVNRAAFSPEEARIVTGSRDNTARLWDGKAGAVLATLGGHQGSVEQATFSPDGSRVVTASADGTARLWDGKTGTPLATLEGHEDSVYSAAFSPDGRRIVTASGDKTARLWDGKTGALLATLQGHQGNVWTAAFSPDGAHIVTASSDKTARLWQVRWPMLRDDTAAYVAIAAVRALTPEERSRAFLTAAPPGAVERTAEPDRHRRLAEGFERAGGARDFERALFHYAVAVRLFEEQGREDEAALTRMRRGSLARALPPQTAVRIGYEAMDWQPAIPADG
jgi:WD40 repeat protein